MTQLNRLLVLGGTSDARQCIRQLGERCPAIDIIHSKAGLVKSSIPTEGLVHSGGFSQYAAITSTNPSLDGLCRYIEQQKISAVADLTHPYAFKISHHALLAAQMMSIPYWRFERPEWQPQEGDDWHQVNSWEALEQATQSFQQPFFTLGGSFLKIHFPIPAHQRWLVRVATKPDMMEAPALIDLIVSVGAGSIEEEVSLLKEHKIDVLISKNSGGNRNKLDAARKLGIPVILLERNPVWAFQSEPIPRIIPSLRFETLDEIIHQITTRLS